MNNFNECSNLLCETGDMIIQAESSWFHEEALSFLARFNKKHPRFLFNFVNLYPGQVLWIDYSLHEMFEPDIQPVET